MNQSRIWRPGCNAPRGESLGTFPLKMHIILWHARNSGCQGNLVTVWHPYYHLNQQSNISILRNLVIVRVRSKHPNSVLYGLSPCVVFGTHIRKPSRSNSILFFRTPLITLRSLRQLVLKSAN